jgi:hypothetical protein
MSATIGFNENKQQLPFKDVPSKVSYKSQHNKS